MTLYLNLYLVPSLLDSPKPASTGDEPHKLSLSYLAEQGTVPESLTISNQVSDKDNDDFDSTSTSSSVLSYLTTLRATEDFCHLLFHSNVTFQVTQLGSVTALQHVNTNHKNISNVIDEEIPNLIIGFDVQSSSFNIQETTTAALIINNSWVQEVRQLPGQIELRDELKNLKLSHNPCYFAICVQAKIPTIKDPDIHPLYQQMSTELQTKIFVLELLHLQN